MLFYARRLNGQIIFATPSEEPLHNPDYEQITQEEYEAFTGMPYEPPIVPPTNEELDAVQTKQAAQIDLLQSQNTFLEDCLMEMASEVYA